MQVPFNHFPFSPLSFKRKQRPTLMSRVKRKFHTFSTIIVSTPPTPYYSSSLCVNNANTATACCLMKLIYEYYSTQCSFGLSSLHTLQKTRAQFKWIVQPTNHLSFSQAFRGDTINIIVMMECVSSKCCLAPHTLDKLSTWQRCIKAIIFASVEV